MMDTMTRERSLSELVQRVHDTGLSYREMAQRAHRAGHTISHSQLALYATGGVAKAPTDAQIRAIAAALDMGYEFVREAVFTQFYGYVPRELNSEKGHSRITAALPPNLSPEDEERIARMIELWLGDR